MRTLLARLAALVRRRRLDDDFEAEMRSHLEMATEQRIRRGLPPEDARRAALAAFGGRQQAREHHRDQRSFPVVAGLWRDARVGARMLWREPGVTGLVVLCLTLGIGANAVVLSWAEGILLRPYPLVARQDRMVALGGTARGEDRGTALSWPDFLDLTRNAALLDAAVVSKITGTTLNIGERADVVTGSIVSANYFDALGIRPMLGRGFATGEDAGRKAHAVTVISFDLWTRRFNADPDIVGKTQRLGGELHTIVGVAPPGFYGTFVGWAMQFWVPASMEELFEAGGYKLEDRGARWIEAYAFLKPGVTLAQAQEELSSSARQLETTFPDTNRGRGARLWPLWQTPFNNAGTLLPTLEIMTAVAAFVLLIACANVGNLLLVRSLARAREMTIRLAIGAGHGRLIAQLFLEGLLLSALSGLGALSLAYACRHALVRLLPARSGVPMHLPGELDWRVLLIGAAISLGVTVVVCLVPALHVRKIDLAGALKSSATNVAGHRGHAWIRSTLVVAQVALSFVLLVGGGLLLQSLQRIRSADPGFLTTSVVTTSVPLVAAGYDAPRAKVFQEALVDRLQALPGVVSAAFGRMTPLSYGTYLSAPVAVAGYVPPPDEQTAVLFNQVGPGYLATMGIRLEAGREFTRLDTEQSEPVAVVNETMAGRYWPGRTVMGARFQMNGRPLTVVGVAADTKYENMREAPRAFFYVPLRQAFSISAAVNLRTTQPLESISTLIAREVRALDAGLAPAEIITMRDQLERSTSPQLVAVTLVGILSALALILAAVGLYGVMSHAVSQSAKELRLRVALGAGASSLVGLVLSRGLRLTSLGVGLGALAAVGLTQFFGALLYQVSPHDVRAFGTTLVVMVLMACVACLAPAWRAAHTDPLASLRDE